MEILHQNNASRAIVEYMACTTLDGLLVFAYAMISRWILLNSRAAWRSRNGVWPHRGSMRTSHAMPASVIGKMTPSTGCGS